MVKRTTSYPQRAQNKMTSIVDSDFRYGNLQEADRYSLYCCEECGGKMYQGLEKL